jgi:hypothetical protein
MKQKRQMLTAVFLLGSVGLEPNRRFLGSRRRDFRKLNRFRANPELFPNK